MSSTANLQTRSEKEIFFEALSKPSGPERAAYLDGACGTDPVLRRRLEELLANHSDTNSFLKQPAVDGKPTVVAEAPLTEGPGTQIGFYRLLEKIGEGGFGVIYVAEQRTPVKRRVALKIIKLGMDTRQVVARFEAERQALALMDHPNIAKVLDAGATETGRPYFVMELVRGVPITQYCDESHLTPVERLKLFTQVCHAIQHAHQKGIIHRDIKPSNILVTLHDGVPVPKVIDFGIAKATQGDLTDKTNYTQFQQFIGTPAYMSPEQAEMSGLDIDTRSDIYALGVLLYELLVGKTPFEPKELLQAGLDEMRRKIREQEPLRPSTRVSSMTGEESTTTAKRRGLEMNRLITLLRGDLDWIVMKCLEKDRARRYETANGLAMDIQRHLSHEPVIARPPSTLYRFQKLVWRNKLAFAGAAAVVAALAIGFAISTWQFLEKNKAYLRALAAEQAENRLRERAEASELSAQRNLYVADMILAQQALDSGNLGRTLELLSKYQTNAPLRNLRGWEWRYMWRRCRSDELFPLGKHSGIVSAVAFSPDGNILASAGHDRVVKLWDMVRRREIGTFVHEDSVQQLAFSADGKTLATAATSQGVSLWDVATQRQLFSTRSGYLPFWTCSANRSLAFSPTRTELLAIGDQDGKVTLWNAADRSALFNLPGITNTTGALAFSPDGRTLAGIAQGSDSSIVFWNVATGTVKARFDTRSWVRHALAFSPDGKTLATYLSDEENPFGRGMNQIVALVDANTGLVKSSHTNHTAWISAVVFSPNGKILASASADHTIRLWDVEAWNEIAVLRGHLQEVRALAFSPDGKTLASGSKDETIKLWGVAPHPGENTHYELRKLGESLISPDGSVFLTRHHDGTITFWNTKDCGKLGNYPIPSTTFLNWALAPGGAVLAFGEPNGQIKLWSRASQSLLANFRAHDGEIDGLIFSRDGSVLVSVGKDQTVKAWQVISQKQIANLAAPHRWRWTPDLALSADGAILAMKFVAEKTPDGLVKLWNLPAGQEIALLKAHHQGIFDLAFAPDGTAFATASVDGTAKIWDLATLECKDVLQVGLSWACSISFSPDGRRLAIGTDAGGIKIWDTITSQEVASLRAGKRAVGKVLFADDDTLFALSGDAFLWRAASFTECDAKHD